MNKEAIAVAVFPATIIIISRVNLLHVGICNVVACVGSSSPGYRYMTLLNTSIP